MSIRNSESIDSIGKDDLNGIGNRNGASTTSSLDGRRAFINLQRLLRCMSQTTLDLKDSNQRKNNDNMLDNEGKFVALLDDRDDHENETRQQLSKLNTTTYLTSDALLGRAELAKLLLSQIPNPSPSLQQKVHHQCHLAQQMANRKRQMEGIDWVDEIFFKPNRMRQHAKSNPAFKQKQVDLTQNHAEENNLVTEEEPQDEADADPKSYLFDGANTDTSSAQQRQQERREELETEIAHMASRLKESTQQMHTTLKTQTDTVLEQMTDLAEQNVNSVQSAAEDVQDYNSKSWSQTVATWTLILVIMASFAFVFVTIRVVPKRRVSSRPNHDHYYHHQYLNDYSRYREVSDPHEQQNQRHRETDESRVKHDYGRQNSRGSQQHYKYKDDNLPGPNTQQSTDTNGVAGVAETATAVGSSMPFEDDVPRDLSQQDCSNQDDYDDYQEDDIDPMMRVMMGMMNDDDAHGYQQEFMMDEDDVGGSFVVEMGDDGMFIVHGEDDMAHGHMQQPEDYVTDDQWMEDDGEEYLDEAMYYDDDDDTSEHFDDEHPYFAGNDGQDEFKAEEEYDDDVYENEDEDEDEDEDDTHTYSGEKIAIEPGPGSASLDDDIDAETEEDHLKNNEDEDTIEEQQAEVKNAEAPDDNADFSWTPNDLHMAATHGNVATVREILQLRPDWIRHRDGNGWEVLHDASRWGRTEVIAYLMQSHMNAVDWNSRTAPRGDGGTALWWAQNYGNLGAQHPAIQLLQSVGARAVAPHSADTGNGNDEGDGSESATNIIHDPAILKSAAYHGKLDLMQQILDANPEWVNHADDGGWAVIHEASRQGHVDIVRFLLERGAQAEVMTVQGLSPLDLAIEAHRDNVVDILQKHIQQSKSFRRDEL